MAQGSKELAEAHAAGQPRRHRGERFWMPAAFDPGSAGWLIRWLVLWLVALAPARAELQFDAFVGYGLGANEGVAAEDRWYPILFEIYNDGPGFNGSIVLGAGPAGQDCVVPVELPTGTRKRVLVPRYASGRWLSLSAQLRDSKGRVRASHAQLRPRTVTDRQSPLVGSLSRTVSGAAFFPEPVKGAHQLQAAVARLSPEMFPDNVIALDGLSALYLHPARALELKAPQVTALLAWLHAGGHLIVGIEQPSEVNGLPWLASLLPLSVNSVTTVAAHGALQAWLDSDSRQPPPTQTGPALPRRPGRAATNAPAAQTQANPFARLEAEAAFETAPLPVAAASLRDGRVLLGSDQAPLAVQAARGRGTLTVLLFSPELEPFRSWKHRGWFWAKLTDVPIEWLAGWNAQRAGGYHIDGVFGAVTDSKQVRKLPVGWLFALLLTYLAVIGPVDRHVLKRLDRQMLTWITFPAYVALFSVLIYFIGYRLRAGESEWNEFHVVDAIPHGDRADLRGHAYGSIYSPVNARYAVACEAACAALRGEVSYYGGQEMSRALVEQQGNSFKARLEAAIWTSQLYVNDWWRQGAAPVQFGLRPLGGETWEVTVTNRLGKRIPSASLVLNGRLHELGELGPTNTFVLEFSKGTLATEYAVGRASAFSQAVEARRSQWARQGPSQALDPRTVAIAASFLEESPLRDQRYPNQGWRQTFATPPSLDLTPNLKRGDAILLAWLPGETLVRPLNQFTPKRANYQTLLRVIKPAG